MSNFMKSGLVCEYLLYGSLNFFECLKYIIIKREEKKKREESPEALKTVSGQLLSVSVSSAPLHSESR